MKTMHSGPRPASPALARVVEQLLAAYPGPLQLLTGLRLPEANTGQGLALDLVAITDTAIIVGVEVPAGDAPAPAPPQVAALAVARLQRERLGEASLPVYAFWCGAVVPPGYTGGAPALPSPEAVLRFIEHASAQAKTARPEAASRLAEALRQADLGEPPVAAPEVKATIAAAPPPPVKKAADGGVWRVLRDLRDLPGQLDAGLRERIRQPLPLRREAVRPADVQRHLEAAMLDPDNLLEDARYSKVVPNEYMVELEPENYERQYRQIERRLCEQWQVKLLEGLETANQRQGRRVYQFGGPVRVSLRPGAGLAPADVRIRSRIAPEAPAAPAPAGCLQVLPQGRHWPLLPGTLTLGRHETSDIYLEAGSQRQPPLISAHHAYVTVAAGEVRLFDGSPSGRPSLNGTFVNGQRVPAAGQVLAPGDVIVLAPLNPKDPGPSGDGVIALTFHERCPDA
jgi:hypothetical protein